MLRLLWLSPGAWAAPPDPLTPVPNPISATTADGKTVVLREDGTWGFAEGEVPADEAPAVAPAEQVGAWSVALGRSAVTGRATGGATTPNLDGAGYMAVTCDGPMPVTVFVFADTPLHELDLAADRAPFGPVAVFRVPDGRGSRKLSGRALEAVQAAVVSSWTLMDLLADRPRDELVVERRRPDRDGWPDRVRYSLDGFRAVWSRVEAACQGRQIPAG